MRQNLKQQYAKRSRLYARLQMRMFTPIYISDKIIWSWAVYIWWSDLDYTGQKII